jgi:hypothetical protein
MRSLAPHIRAAHTAGDRWTRIRTLADVMRDLAATHGACTSEQLRARGFTLAEQLAYGDDARAILSGRPTAGRSLPSPAKAEGERLVQKARRVRRQLDAERAA